MQAHTQLHLCAHPHSAAGAMALTMPTRTITSIRAGGLKSRVEKLLHSQAGQPLTLGEIGAALDFPKTSHPEISSCLAKLREAGAVQSAPGPASSARGRRQVQRYSILLRRVGGDVRISEMDARRALAMTGG